MGRGRLLLLCMTAAMTAAGLAVLVDCVGDEPASDGAGDGSTIGQEGAPCYGNGTCDPGLECLSNVCVRVDGGADGGILDGGGSDGTTGDSGEDACPLVLPDTGPGPFCPFQAHPDGGAFNGNCAGGEQCCEYSGAAPSICMSASGSCPPQQSQVAYPIVCESNTHCPGQKCCLRPADAGPVTAEAGGGPACSPNFGIVRNVIGSTCLTTCVIDQMRTCSNDAECGAKGPCILVQKFSVTFGVCQGDSL